MNVVTGDLDRGPVISWCAFPIRDAQNERLWAGYADGEPGDDNPLFLDIRARGVERERPFLAETLRAIADRRLSVPPGEPLDLTDQVEASIAGAQRQRAGGAV